MERGLLIAFEGLDGAGITTQAERAKDNLEEETPWETYLTKEPTDGPAGTQLKLGLSGRVDFDPKTLALLFATDRMDHLQQDILPKIDGGVIVIMDRYYLSSYAYQQMEVDLEWLKCLNEKCLTPDLTIFLDVSAQVALRRMKRERWHVELYEKEQELNQVFENYQDVIADLKGAGEDIRIVDGNNSKDAVEKEISTHINDKLDEKGRDPQTT